MKTNNRKIIEIFDLQIINSPSKLRFDANLSMSFNKE